MLTIRSAIEAHEAAVRQRQAQVFPTIAARQERVSVDLSHDEDELAVFIYEDRL